MNDTFALDTEDMLLLDKQICFPLYAASNLLNRLYRPILAQFNLTYPQYLVMLVLWESSPCSVGDLGSKLFLDSGTLTPLLKRLATNGLITRQRDPEDERRVIIKLTLEGEQLKQQIVIVPATLANSLQLETAEIEQLRHQVQQLVGVMSKQLHLIQNSAHTAKTSAGNSSSRQFNQSTPVTSTPHNKE